MNKILTVLGIFLFFMGIGSSASAQQTQVSGTVLDSDGNPIKFATVQVVGTAGGISADELGRFKIQARPGQQLQITSTGYEPNVIQIGTSSILEIRLVSTGNNLGEVVVTALGLSRAKKTLGYAVQELNNSALVDAANNNIVNTISGKIAGAQVADNKHHFGIA